MQVVNPMNQSELKANTCSRRQARENAKTYRRCQARENVCKQVMIGLGFFD